MTAILVLSLQIYTRLNNVLNTALVVIYLGFYLSKLDNCFVCLFAWLLHVFATLFNTNNSCQNFSWIMPYDYMKCFDKYTLIADLQDASRFLDYIHSFSKQVQNHDKAWPYICMNCIALMSMNDLMQKNVRMMMSPFTQLRYK